MAPSSASACPSGFGDCFVDLDGSPNQVCYSDTGAGGTVTWMCDARPWDSLDNDLPAKINVVSDYDLTVDLEAWGEVDGVQFCCNVNNVTHVEVHGSKYSDTLQLEWQAGTYNLEYPECVSAKVFGHVGGDYISGSNDATGSYAEELYGGDGNDSMFGRDGDDGMSGGDNNDTMNGGDGIDTMLGEAGDDTMIGGGGDDIMTGGDDNDLMAGYGGDDDMDGGPGADIMCGDGHSLGDTLVAGDSDASSVDKLWSTSTLDTTACGASSTLWDGVSIGDVDCGSSYISSRPAFCP